MMEIISQNQAFDIFDQEFVAIDINFDLFNDQFDNLMEWCNDNFGQRAFMSLNLDRRRVEYYKERLWAYTSNGSFGFRKINDMILFKMRWC